MSLTATCGVVRTAGSRGASMLAVMWWVAPWADGVVRVRPGCWIAPAEGLPGGVTTDWCEHEPAPSEVARAHSAPHRIRVPPRTGQPGAPGRPATRRGSPTQR